MEEERVYSCAEAGEAAGVTANMAQRWAASNGVRFVGNGRGKLYQWSADDIERFKNRQRKPRK